MSWSNQYVGLPQADLGRDRLGCDCWGLACIIYREELGISLPEYLGYGSPDEHGEVAALIEGVTRTPLWLPVSGPAIAFDIAVFRRGRMSTHVGIVVRHGIMVHMVAEDQSKVESYASGQWKNRFTGHWRHCDMALKHPIKSPIESEIQRPVTLISEAAR